MMIAASDDVKTEILSVQIMSLASRMQWIVVICITGDMKLIIANLHVHYTGSLYDRLFLIPCSKHVLSDTLHMNLSLYQEVKQAC
jgi:hypothetical protein